MAVLKLSQIAAAGAAPAAGDVAVGVTGGTTDNLFTYTQVATTVLNTVGLTVGSAKLVGGTSGRVLFDNAGVIGEDAGFTYVAGGQATLALGTITTNLKALNITGTWNNAATTFDAPLFMNITNTASNAASLLADFQVGSASVATLQVDGSFKSGISGTSYVTTLGGGSAPNISLVQNGVTDLALLVGTAASIAATKAGQDFTISNSGPSILLNPAGNALGVIIKSNQMWLANGANAQLLHIYNTTDGSFTNYERAVLDWTTTANVLTIGTQKGGTGTARNIYLNSAGGVTTINGGQFAAVGRLVIQGGGSESDLFCLDNSNINKVTLGWACNGIVAGTVQVDNSGAFGFSASNAANSTFEAGFYRDAAVGLVALADIGSKTTATGLRIYNTTDQAASNTAPTNYERGVFDFTTTANTLTIGTQAGGTGTLRNVALVGNQIQIPNKGTSGTPALAFTGVSAGTGFYITSAQTNLVVEAPSSGINALIASLQFVVPSNGSFGFLNSTSVDSTTVDSSLARIAAKVIGMGDGVSNANGWMQWAGELRTTSATNYTNNTPTTIMSVALAAGRSYSFDGYIPVTAGGNAGGVQVVLLASGGLTATAIQVDSVAFSNNANVGQVSVSSITTLTSVVLGATTGYVEFHGTITVNVAGTLNFQTAQSATNATTMTIGRGARVFLYDMP